MHIRLIETGYKPRRLYFDVSGPLEEVTRRIIDDFFKYDTSAYITAIRFTKFDAILYEYSGAVFVRLKDAAAYELREKLTVIYPGLKTRAQVFPDVQAQNKGRSPLIIPPMHIRLIENGETPRRVFFDVDENMESVTRWIIDGVLPHTAGQIAAIRFIPIRAELFDFAGTVFMRLDYVTSRKLREKLTVIYPALK